MGRTTYMHRALLVTMAAILGIVVLPAPASSAEPTFTPVKRYDIVRTLVFPVVGITKYSSSFGDCRDNCTREHFGIDISTYGWKGLPVVAAQSGTVTKVTYNEGNAGCSIRIRSRDRWETRYLHLNSDFPGTDEIGYPCVAPGIEVGTKVEAGQLISWIGDSGNSEDTVPHIHFELRSRSGYPIDPYKSLKRSRKVVYEWLPSDASAASIILSRANHADGAPVTFVVSSDDVGTLEQSEKSASILQAPVVVFDPESPQPALDEIARLDSGRIVIFSDEDVTWLTNRLMRGTRIVETAALPVKPNTPIMQSPDGLEMPVVEPNTPDKFPTIISGAIDRIWRSRKDEYATFTKEHRSLVLASARWANRGLGQKSWSSPGKYADRKLLWWTTGDGWIGTESLEDIPSPGFAYVTERRATPWTLAFLGSLAEAPPMPVWKDK